VPIMSVNPGFGGQSFIPQAIEKIRQTRAILDAHGSKAIVQVDGGITAATIRATYDAGARNFVAGTAVSGIMKVLRVGCVPYERH